ncbi:MAG: transcriptional regulator [Chitinophagaceae bacterium BSSC1]|jgi:BlaI family penicillinase repressor|nr:MAG: transcriptional regulator [Chitinophagaceae bacterium BSSC1]
MKKLTQAEEQIMHVLWDLGKGGFLKEILENLQDQKAHHNTIATLLKILVEKGFVGIQNPNRNNFYYPIVTKEAYSEQRIAGLTESYFDGSYTNVISFLVDKKQMSIQDLEILLKQLKKKSND